jgi:ribosomal protein S18 acetylase RimI-like enzyme
MWCLLEERARKYPLAMTKIAIAYRDYRVIAGNLRRLQLNVRCSDQRAFRWAKAIGFEPEAKMRRYGPDGSDFYLMSRV